MLKRTKSLLEELESVGTAKDVDHIIENRAHNIISSAIHLVELMQRYYPEERVELLEKKLLSSIKSKDKSRFAKSLKKTKNEDK